MDYNKPNNEKSGKLLLEVDVESRANGQYIVRAYGPASSSTPELTSFYSDVEQVKETLKVYCRTAKQRDLIAGLTLTKDARRKLGIENEQKLYELVQSF